MGDQPLGLVITMTSNTVDPIQTQTLYGIALLTEIDLHRDKSGGGGGVNMENLSGIILRNIEKVSLSAYCIALFSKKN